MATIAYKVTSEGDQWSVTRDGRPPEMTYITQEAAFEAAAAAAGGDLRSGHAIVIQVVAATDPCAARDLGGSPIEGDGFHV
jgi:Uncharacterized protein conserved in bacteria (DUF2188)